MRKMLIVLFTLVLSISTFATEVIIFTDDFESGSDNWSFVGGPDWGLVETESVSPTHSLTESPAGNYGANLSYYATMANPLDLSTAVNAWMTYNIKYEIEIGDFDWGYVEVSTDGGANWLILLQFAAEPMTAWENITVPLAGFVGNSEVFIRFSLVTDGGYEIDGMYIDDVVVTTSDVDDAPPLIVYSDPPQFYQASMDAYTFVADLVDFSGIAEAKVVYQVDGGSSEEAMSTGNTGDTYSFEIPVQVAGAQVDFFISATDNSSNSNNATTEVYHYIQGEYLVYDNTIVDFYTTFAPGTGGAVRMSIEDTKQMLWALIRNYADQENNPEPDNYEFHVWADDFGAPGADLITPFMVLGEAVPENNSPATRVDLTQASLDDLTDCDVFVGFIAVDETFCTISQTSGMLSERSWAFDGAAWALVSGTDYHFRAVLGGGNSIDEEETLISSFELNQNYPNPFNPTTSISFALESNANVQLAIFDAKGAIVANLVNGNVNSGAHSVEFNGANLSTGVYYYTLKVNGISQTKKMMLLK